MTTKNFVLGGTRGPRASDTPLPTDAELAILSVLWHRERATVREVHEELSGETGYTTTLKLMQVMASKGLLVRDESTRSHVYSPSHKEGETQSRLLSDLADRAFAGSASRLVLRLLSSRPTSAEELANIRQLLDELEAGDGKR